MTPISTSTPPWFADAEAFASLPSAGPELLIGLDIDGTILHHDTTLAERVKRAYLAHVEAGTHIMVVTGRGVAGAQEALNQLGVEAGYAVCSNGAIIVHVGDLPCDSSGAQMDPIFGSVSSLPPEAIQPRPSVQLIRAHTFNPQHEIEQLMAGIPGAFLAVESTKHVRRITAEFPPGELSGSSVIVPIHELATPDATRLTVRAPHMSASELLECVNSLGLHGIEYAVGWSAWLDITPKGISKAVGMNDVREALGLAHAHTVAIGDSGNDCEMLEWAHLGVAMGNAPEYVRSYANAVTSSIDDDGAALVLEALLR